MMTEFALVGDIGGTNSRFGLVKQGSMAIQHMVRCHRRRSPG
jgi:glucokinase